MRLAAVKALSFTGPNRRALSKVNMGRICLPLRFTM
jgi:hypothetical protein